MTIDFEISKNMAESFLRQNCSCVKAEKVSSISSDLIAFFKSANVDFSDVEFLIGGETVKGHRVILASRSEYFNALFLDQERKGEKERLKIEVDVDFEIFQCCMDWMYRDEFALPQEKDRACIQESRIWEYWMVANYFLLAPLAERIEEHISLNFLKLDNVCSFWNHLTNYNHVSVEQLKSKCKDYFIQNLTNIVSDNQHVCLDKTLMIEVFSDPSVNLALKTLAMTRWIAHRNPEIVKRKIESLPQFQANKRRRIDTT